MSEPTPLIVVQPASENKFKRDNLLTIVAPIDPNTIINQGSMLKIVSGQAVPTAAKTDDICGIADGQNPVASLGDKLTSVKILLSGNVVSMDAPATETFTFGQAVYALDDATYHYTGAITGTGGEGVKQVGIYVGKNGVTGGTGVKVLVKLVCGQKI